jgi:hypothetical protein
VVGALAVGHAARLRYGIGCGIAAAVLAIGSAPLKGFGVMARCDVMADVLGFIGFLLVVGARGKYRLFAGIAILSLAILTKQTTAFYLFAAVIAILLTENRLRAVVVAAGGLGLTGLAILALFLSGETEVVPSLLGEAHTPTDLVGYRIVLDRLLILGRELIYFPLIGMIYWLGRRHRDVPLAVLTLVSMLACFVTALKLGSNLNYFMPLRLLAPLGAAVFLHDIWLRTRPGPDMFRWRSARSWCTLALLLAVTYNFQPSLLHAQLSAGEARELYLFYKIPEGLEVVSVSEIFRKGASATPETILTDDGQIALYQTDKAPFTDPWLFRMMVETGRIKPTRLIEKIENEQFDTLVTTKDIFSREYETYTYGFPPVVLAALREHYIKFAAAGRMFIYGPIRRGSEIMGQPNAIPLGPNGSPRGPME